MQIAVWPIPAAAVSRHHGLDSVDDRARNPDRGAKIGDDIELLETRNVFGIDESGMGDVVSWTRPMEIADDFDRIQRVPHGRIAGAMYLDGEPELLGLGDPAHQFGMAMNGRQRTACPCSSGA